MSISLSPTRGGRGGAGEAGPEAGNTAVLSLRGETSLAGGGESRGAGGRADGLWEAGSLLMELGVSSRRGLQAQGEVAEARGPVVGISPKGALAVTLAVTPSLCDLGGDRLRTGAPAPGRPWSWCRPVPV